MNATVTIGIEDYERLKKRIVQLEGEISAARAETDAAKLADPDGIKNQLVTALNHSIEIVRFAIGNLHPLTVRGWPYRALRALGDMAPTLPGIDPSVREVARGDWKLVTDEMERWEKARAEGREKELLAEENAGRAPGPDHPVFGS